MPLLSVVVPVHNVERYLAACLDSLRVQSLADLEVVLVDDGSTDRSTAIAEDFCARDPRFRLVRQDNAGAGPARNLGVTHAGGEYLAFVDSDDLTHRRMYELLVGSLQATGSDFAISRASRFSNLGQTPSMLHDLAMSEPVSATRIDRRPDLVLDRMIWNTVYRRSFWDAAGEDGGPLTYRAMMLQDYPVSLRAHLAATSVDVRSECLYYWRERDGGDLSLTQRSNEIAHVADRFASANIVLDLVEPRLPASLPLLRRHLLEVDVHAITGAMTTMTGDDRATALGYAQRLVARLGPDAGASSPAFYRVQAAMVGAGDDELLTRLHEHARVHGKVAPVEVRGLLRKHWYETFPGFGSLPLPPYERKGGEPTETAALADARWDGDRIVVDVRLSGGTESTVAVEPDTSSTGFVAVRVPGHGGGLAVGGPPTGRTRYLAARTIGGATVQPQFRGSVFGYSVLRPFAKVDELAVAGESLRITGRLLRGQEAGALLVGDRVHPVAAAGDRFTVEVPAASLADAPDHLAQLGIQTSYPVRLEVGGTPRVLALPPGLPQAVVAVGHRMVTATRNGGGLLEVVESRVTPIVDEVAWTGASTLRIAGTWLGPQPLPAALLLEHFERPGEAYEHPVPVQRDGRRFAVEVDVAALPVADDPYLGPDAGPWHLVLRFDDHVTVPVLDRTAAAAFAEPRPVAGRRVAVGLGRNDVVRLLVSPA